MLEDPHRRRQRAPRLLAELGAARTGGEDQAVIAERQTIEHALPFRGVADHRLAEKDLDAGGSPTICRRGEALSTLTIDRRRPDRSDQATSARSAARNLNP